MKPGTPDGSDPALPGVVAVYDTTLRDGTQREGLSLSAVDKLRIARLLDEMGVSFVELGWPGSNPKDAEVFERAGDVEWKNASLAAFGSTRRAGCGPDADPQVAALLATRAPVCTIFGKSSVLHVREVLRISDEENLRMIADTVGYLVENKRRVIYDAEHFFDGYRENPDFAMETLRAAARAGAETLVLCDTNGGSLPWQIEERVAAVVKALGCPIGIHAHDDTGCAVANSIAAVRAGATHVQGTLNGYGERCGNANLCSIVPNLELKMGRRCLRPGALAELTHVAWQAAEIANLAPDAHAAYVGRSAFAHKGGVHVAAIRRHPRAYEHVDPATVGNKTRVVVSELSGRGNLLSKAEEFEVTLEAGATTAVLRDLKEREARGFAFEAAEASVALMMRRESAGYVAPFELVDYKVIVGQRAREEAFSEATIKLRVLGELVHTAAEGNGPVDALDAALRKALAGAYPEIAGIHLEDYKVRILDTVAGTSAITRVMIDTRFGEERWSTVGASTNVLEASWLALADGIEYGLGLVRASRPPEALVEKGAA
ncbi:MAG TPA: citramalate synthase [Polyangiaceae bacterium]|jgi:2-isopropylmalate synthase|nr:citramalate synthase [Polyangiaceae bacterium]